MFVVHDTLLNQRKMKKNTMFIYKISSFFLKIMVFFQKKDLLCIYCHKTCWLLTHELVWLLMTFLNYDFYIFLWFWCAFNFLIFFPFFFFQLCFSSPSSTWIMPSRCYNQHIYLIICFAIRNMSLCWNCWRRWLFSICIVCLASWAHSMSNLFPWILHRLWRQMGAFTITWTIRRVTTV